MTTGNRRMRVFNESGKQIKIRATALSYATMTRTDLALYKIEQTYEELEAKGVTSLILNDNMPSSNTEIEIISGYWRKGYSCRIDGIVDRLKEHHWVFVDSIRYTAECDIISGTSGSPIIERRSRRVIGVNNTYNNNKKLCALHSPCEIDQAGNVTSVPHIGYGQQTHWLYSCVDKDFQIDLKKQGVSATRC